ncbi:MAG: polysaccharide export protein [Alphaproteobacteria bacterium]|nr:polysaccharide export protein [Alphaproteobacteria bacterium]
MSAFSASEPVTHIPRPPQMPVQRDVNISPPMSSVAMGIERETLPPIDLTPSAPMEQKSVSNDARGYRLGPDDKIDINVFGEKDLSGDFKLGGDGSISMPLIGVVLLNNLTLREAENLIEAKFKGGYLKDPSVSIEVLESRPFYILGEVRRPGSYNYINGMSALEAIAISGGFTYRANRKKIDILRRGHVPTEPQPFTPDTTIQAGDIIFVRERFF